MKSYIFNVTLQQEQDGRWSSFIHPLPGCSSWGHTKEEALSNIRDAAEIYIEDMIESNKELPHPSNEVEIINSPVVSISI